MPSVITSVDTFTKTHGEEKKRFQGEEKKKGTSKPCTKYCDFSHTQATLLTFPNVKPSWHLQPTQHSPQLFLPCNGFSSFLTTYVQDKHLRLWSTTNFSVLVAVQHIIWSYGTGFFKDNISRSQKSAPWSLLRSPSKRFDLSGQSVATNIIIFIPLQVDVGFLFQEACTPSC